MMPVFLSFAVLSCCGATLMAQTSQTNAPAESAKLPTTIVDWQQMKPEAVTNGVRRFVLEGPTAGVDKLHCHITTLNPGEISGAPRLHLHEEIIIVKEGRIEASYDGHKQTVGPGSDIFSPRTPRPA